MTEQTPLTDEAEGLVDDLVIGWHMSKVAGDPPMGEGPLRARLRAIEAAAARRAIEGSGMGMGRTWWLVCAAEGVRAGIRDISSWVMEHGGPDPSSFFSFDPEEFIGVVIATPPAPDRGVSFCAEHDRWEHIPADLDHDTDPHEPSPPPPPAPAGSVVMAPTLDVAVSGSARKETDMTDIKSDLDAREVTWATSAQNGLDAFAAGFRARHEWPGEEPIDLFRLAPAVHSTKAIQHKAGVSGEMCGSCRDEALGILVALGIPPRKSALATARDTGARREGGS